MSEFAGGLNQGLSFVVRNNAPQGKSLKVFNHRIANGSTLDLMRIPGISEDDIKASLVKGELGQKLASNYLKAVSSTLNFDSSDPVYTSLLTSYGLSASTGGAGEGLVTNVAALTSINISNEVDGAEREISTLLQVFKLDKSSTATVDNITVAATNSGVGRWLRVSSHVPKWTNQITWGVDTTSGNDENSGADSVGNRLKTVSEVARRLAGLNYTNYTINVIGTVASTDTAKWSGKIVSGGNAAPTAMRIHIVGTRTPVAGFPGGTIGTATATDVVTSPSTGLSQATITDAAVSDWSPYADPSDTTKSKLLVITSGPNAGLTAWTLFANPSATTSVLNGGADATRVRVSNWTNATLNTINGTASGAIASAAVVASLSGQTYTINDVASYLAPNNPTAGISTRVELEYTNFQFSAFFQARGAGRVRLHATKHVGTGGGPTGSLAVAEQAAILVADGCLVHFTGLGSLTGAPGVMEAHGCAFVGSTLTPYLLSMYILTSCVLQSSCIITSDGGANLAVQPGVQGAVTVNGEYGLGVYDVPTVQNGITIRRGGVFITQAALHGFGAVAGSLLFCAVYDGGTLMIKTGTIPTGTNTGGQVQLEGATTAMPPLEASAGGSLPALSALTTWAHWNAAPFSRNVMNFGAGSKIIDFTGNN